MAENFQSCNEWWNNSRSRGFNGSQAINSPSTPSLSRSTKLNESFSWHPTNEISESKPRLCDNQIDDSLHISDLGFSTLSTDWNQPLLRCSGKTESSFQAMIHQDDLSSERPFSRPEPGESSTTIQLKNLNFSTSGCASSSVYSSSLYPGLVDMDKRFQQPMFFDNQQMADPYPSQMSACHGFSNETLEPSLTPELLGEFRGFHSVADLKGGMCLSACGWLFESKPGCSVTVKSSEGVPEKKTNESELKKPRIEALSPVPAAFKVRKEKVGDKITALQQLVSPFGKTATASVLHETIEYIKYLHDQVSVLCSPYLRNIKRPMQQEKKLDKLKEGEEPRQDLRSRGLCLVPIASNYIMDTHQNNSDFWTPIPGRTFW